MTPILSDSPQPELGSRQVSISQPDTAVPLDGFSVHWLDTCLRFESPEMDPGDKL